MDYSLYVPGLAKKIKAYPIFLMAFGTITSRYINNLLPVTSDPGLYTIYNLLLLNSGILLLA